MAEKQDLWAMARELRSEMRGLQFMLQGSVLMRRMKCGKPNCKCTKGHLHEVWCVTYKEKGKTRMVYIHKTRQGEALWWSRNYKKYKALLKELTQVVLEILRTPKS